MNGSTIWYLDSDVSKGKTYYYSVRAVNLIGESNLSDTASVEIPKEKAQPTPSIDFVWILGAMGFIVVIQYIWRKKRDDV